MMLSQQAPTPPPVSGLRTKAIEVPQGAWRSRPRLEHPDFVFIAKGRITFFEEDGSQRTFQAPASVTICARCSSLVYAHVDSLMVFSVTPIHKNLGALS